MFIIKRNKFIHSAYFILLAHGAFFVPIMKSSQENAVLDINTRMFHAISNNNIKNLQEAIDLGADLSTSLKGDEDIVSYLHSQDTEGMLEITDFLGMKPLVWAAFKGHEDVVEFLLKNKANINTTTTNGETPLMWASEYGHEGVVRVLLENEASIEKTDSDGWTALAYAAGSRHEAIVELLAQNGADVERRDRSGYTPLMFATFETHDSIVEKESQKEYESMARLLVRYGADINQRTDVGTPLEVAIFGESKDMVEFFLKHSADTVITNSIGNTPLMLAVIGRNEVIVETLLHYKATIQPWPRMRGHLCNRYYPIPCCLFSLLVRKRGTEMLLSEAQYKVCNQPELAKKLLQFGAIYPTENEIKNIDRDKRIALLSLIAHDKKRLAKEASCLELILTKKKVSQDIIFDKILPFVYGDNIKNKEVRSEMSIQVKPAMLTK